MKKIFTLLTFVFLSQVLMYGQCPDIATPNPNGRFFNLSFTLEADRDAALVELESISFPAGLECMCGDIVTVPAADLVIDSPNETTFRIRADGAVADYFSGENGNFTGTVTFNSTDGGSVDCNYGATAVNDDNFSEPIRLFPNPVKDQLTLINAKGKATIYNVLGQLVKQFTINSDQETIQLADLLNGQYYLQLLQKDGTMVTKQFSKTN